MNGIYAVTNQERLQQFTCAFLHPPPRIRLPVRPLCPPQWRLARLGSSEHSSHEVEYAYHAAPV